MAMITDQRLKEMEEEMNRFEQEILTPKDGQGSKPRPIIIGANTFSSVQARISGDIQTVAPPPPPPPGKPTGPPPAPPGSKPAGPISNAPTVSLPASMLAAPPPPPPALLPKPNENSDMPPLVPPPPPPPSIRPSFVPHQIRHRPPPPRPPPHRFGPPGGPGPYFGPPGPHGFPGPHGPGPFGPHGPGGPMPHFRGPGPMPPGPIGPGYGVSDGVQHMMANDGSGNSMHSPQKEDMKPKIVISAGPVINKPITEKKKKKEKKAKMSESVEGETPNPTETTEVTQKVVAGPTLPAELQVEEPAPVEMEVEEVTKKKKEKKKKIVRTAAGVIWEDPSLEEWDPDDFRMFCGDLGNEVTDEVLARAFSKYPTFVKAKVLRDKRTNKTRGYGFVSFKDPQDFARAMREMNGKYVGNRPIKLRKSNWKDRNIDVVRRKEKEKKRLGLK